MYAVVWFFYVHICAGMKLGMLRKAIMCDFYKVNLNFIRVFSVKKI